MDGVNVRHLSYIGDSVLADNVNIGAGAITANLRHDQKPIKVTVKGKRVETHQKKLGAFIAENAKIAIHCSIMPGVIIGPNAHTQPKSLVNRDII
jgi:NDP-sugar pyrophosphorylase family protein